MYPILKHEDLPQSFVATVAALCVEAARRKATYVEVDFADGMTVRDDGEAFNDRSQWWIHHIGTGRAEAIDYSSKWPLGIYAGLRHTRVIEIHSWPSMGEPKLADELTLDRSAAHRHLNWTRALVPAAPNDPPAHGVAIVWKGLDAGAQPPELFGRLERELRGQLTEPVANLVRLRIPALHGVRYLD